MNTVYRLKGREATVPDFEMENHETQIGKIEEHLHQQPGDIYLLERTWFTCVGQSLDFKLLTLILVQWLGLVKTNLVLQIVLKNWGPDNKNVQDLENKFRDLRKNVRFKTGHQGFNQIVPSHIYILGRLSWQALEIPGSPGSPGSPDRPGPNRQTKKSGTHPSRFWGKSLAWVSYQVSRMPCGKSHLTIFFNSAARAIRHIGLVWEQNLFWIPHLCVSQAEVFAALYGAFGTKVRWAQNMHCLCCWLIHLYTLSWIETVLQYK